MKEKRKMTSGYMKKITWFSENDIYVIVDNSVEIVDLSQHLRI